MKISKLLPVLCVLAVGANCLTVRAQDNPAQAAARAALEKQILGTSGQPSATNAPPQSATQPATNPPPAWSNPVAPAKKEKKPKPAPPAPPVAAVVPTAQASDNNYAGKDLGMKALEAPPLPISAGKELQLQALLLKYRADQISPDDYQKQRAAILAQP